MKTFLRLSWLLPLLLAAVLLPAVVRAADTLLITEFAASNAGPFADEDAEFSDWIEIHNPGTNTVNANGWYLTDSSTDLTKWRIPATNVAPNGYLIIFASDKDRDVPGRPLHTNFKLDAPGEYLGLVRPDGVTVASQFAPVFPPQVARVSYGVTVQQTVTTLLATGAVARYYVPSNDVLGANWIAPGFNDAAWVTAVTGLGYETDGLGLFTPAVIADSVAEFSGKQGSNNWYYGYWNRQTDPNGAYSDLDMSYFPNADGAYGANNYWNGTAWDWFNGDPPFTQISALGGIPNASNGIPARADHWAVRRYVSEVAGPVKITGQLAHTNSGGWVYVTQTGVAANSLIYVYLTGVGSGHLDDMKLVLGSVAEAGANVLPNGDFESALTGPWTVSANHSGSAIVTDVKHGGNSSLRLATSVGGTTQASAIWQVTAPALATNSTYTLSYWFKPDANNTPLVVRFSGNWINTASPAACGDGVLGRIFVDGAEVFQQVAFLSSPQYSVTVPVNFGSRIDFVLDPRADDFCDAAQFTAHLETAEPGTSVVADSVADWSSSGTQGEKNWTYGYYNRTADAGGVYAAGDFTPFPRSNAAYGPANNWTGTIYDLAVGVAPWDEIGQTGMHPNGINSGAEHWVIRRWASEVSGRVTVDWTVAKANLAGGGVTGRLFHNGVPMDTVAIAGTDGAGTGRSVVLTNVHVGDFIDLALDPTGNLGDTADSSDGSTMTLVARGTPTLTDAISSSLQSAMKNVNATAYIRIPFTVTNASSIAFLTLRMRYDDGFVAYLNGSSVASRNALFFQDPLTWNSVATANRFDGDSNQYEDIDITSFAGLLHDGTNVLAIHGLNASAADSDFLILPELRALNVSLGAGGGYFATPTPGTANGLASTNLGPIITDVVHSPEVPADHQDLYVTARVSPTFHAISNVLMIYRVMYSNEVTVAMLDDGAHGDGAAGDGNYGAIIPAALSKPGEMIRYYIASTDIRTNRTRLPAFENPTASPEYFGTIVFLPQTNSLPVLHWFIQTPTAANTTTGGRGSIYFNGQFRDNVKANLHGQSSSQFSTLKKSYNFDMNPGGTLRVSDNDPKVDDFNLLTTWADKSHLRNMINYNTYTESGTPAHFAFAVRVQQNGTFFAVYNFVENGDENYLQRIGFDVNGALYKMYNSAENSTGVEKKTRKTENNADLQALINGSSAASGGTVAARQTFVADNMDIPGVINFLAVKAVTSDHDCCHKNYYFYRDTLNTREWVPLSWDADLSFGRIWSGGPTYFDDVNYTNAAWQVGGNTVMAIFFDASIPKYRQMYMRRVRSLTDRFLGVPGTTNSYYDQRIEEQKAIIRADAALDFAKWTTWGTPMTMDQNANQIRTNYVIGRRAWLNTAQAEIPASQPSNVVVNLLAFDYNPSSGNQAQEFISITNPNNFAVDISDWKIAGGAGFTFKGGTVLPPNSAAYVTPDKAAFRARTSGPRGGQGLLVLGPYDGQLSAWGESISLTDDRGRLVSSNGFAGNPSLAQQYLRVTEIMYHPPAPPAGVTNYEAEDYEYLELRNTGPATLNLAGVHFTNGVEFAFNGGAVTNLASGGYTLIVRNPAAFASRYGSNLNVAGAFAGILDNAGENLRLDDAVGEKILDFSYDNAWYPVTDGPGAALVIVNAAADWKTWGLKPSWRPSAYDFGSPGTMEPPTNSFLPVFIHEVLAHSDPPLKDAIELSNPNALAADIGGWFLTDDLATPKKFRVPDGTMIPAGGHVSFDETQFNAAPGVPPSFALSSLGDEVYVFSGNGTNLTGWVDGQALDATESGVSLGRYTNSQGALHFVAQSFRTFAGPNALPKVGPAIVSEIMYHPPDLPIIGDNAQDEFIELANISGSPLPLFDPANPTNTWRLRSAIDFDFPTNVTLPAGGFAVVTSLHPTNTDAVAAFRAKFSVPMNIPIFGPWSGKLDNSANSVKLEKPDAPLGGAVPYVLVERIDYADTSPWPSAADAFGGSLQRIVAGAYGNDATNWIGAAPTGGGAFVPGGAPVITAPPLSVSVLQDFTAMLNVTVSGTGPFAYQWQFNSNNIVGANSSVLLLPNVSFAQAGAYRVIVLGAGGSAESASAVLSVVAMNDVPPGSESGTPGAPVITSHPQSQAPLATLPVTFGVGATGTPPLLFRWLFNNVQISGATNSTLLLPNVQTGQSGLYRCIVGNSLGFSSSSNATLTVLVPPSITLQPVNAFLRVPPDPLANPTNRVAVFRVTASSSNPPLTYQWRVNGTNVPANDPNITGTTSNTLTLSNVTMQSVGYFSCAVADANGTLYTTEALLGVTPGLLHFSGPVTVAAGANISLNAVVQAYPTPFLYSWRRGSIVLTNISSDSGTNFVTFHSTTMGYNNTSGVLFSNYALRLVFTNLATAFSGALLTQHNTFVTVLGDTDGDGLPDMIETGLGLNPNSALDGALDLDGDGMSNAAEYVAGTDPDNAASYLKVEQTTLPGAAVVNFAGVSNRTYTIQFTDVMPSAAWSRLADVLSRTNNYVQSFPDPAWSSKRFYRVVTPRAP